MLQEDTTYFESTFEYADSNATVGTDTQFTEIEGRPLAARNAVGNSGFIIFMLCFFILVFQIRMGRKKNTPVPSTAATFLSCFQTITLISLFLFRTAEYYTYPTACNPPDIIGFTALMFGTLTLFLICKLFINFIICSVFFDRKDTGQFNSGIISFITLSGYILFIPALLVFYVDCLFYAGVILIILYLIFSVFNIIFKIYVTFFRKNYLLLYFILYLCALEIIPLYLLYRGIMFFINC